MLKLNETTNSKLTTDSIATSIIDALDVELSRLDDKTAAHVTSRLMQIHYTWNIYMTTSIEGITMASTLVYENKHFRDYILNVTVRFLSTLDATDNDVNSLVTSILSATKIVGRKEVEDSITPQVIKDSLSKDESKINTIYSNDRWLITLFFIMKYLHRTITYNILTDKQ